MFKHRYPLFPSNDHVRDGFYNIYIDGAEHFRGAEIHLNRSSAESALSVLKPVYRVRVKQYKNKVPWGEYLSIYLQKQIDAVSKGALPLEIFEADIEKNFSQGLTDRRRKFLTAIKQLARQVDESRKHDFI